MGYRDGIIVLVQTKQSRLCFIGLFSLAGFLLELHSSAFVVIFCQIVQIYIGQWRVDSFMAKPPSVTANNEKNVSSLSSSKETTKPDRIDDVLVGDFVQNATTSAPVVDEPPPADIVIEFEAESIV